MALEDVRHSPTGSAAQKCEDRRILVMLWCSTPHRPHTEIGVILGFDFTRFVTRDASVADSQLFSGVSPAQLSSGLGHSRMTPSILHAPPRSNPHHRDGRRWTKKGGFYHCFIRVFSVSHTSDNGRTACRTGTRIQVMLWSTPRPVAALNVQ